jgi:ketosteroid isomerase-like protein
MTRRQALGAATGLVVTSAAAPLQGSDVDVLKLLDTFAAAWNRHDVDGLMACMTDDCVFEAAAGDQVAGTRHVGREAVRRAYAAVFDTYADARWNQPRHFVAGDRAVSEWTFTGTTRDGAKVEVNGCDLFTLRNGRIVVKNSYRKQRS